MNKGSDALAAIVQERLGMNPFNGHTYVFCAQNASRIKYIKWDGSGFQLCSKRFEYGFMPWFEAKHEKKYP